MQVGTARNQKRLNISNFTRDLRDSRLECLFVGKGLRLVSGFLILVFGLLVSLPVLANADSDNELTIRGTVRVGREVIPDVKVTVENAQNIQIGSEVTGEDGKWEIPIPGLGEYTVTLIGPLPEGITIRDGASDRVTVSVEDYRSKAVGFQLIGEDKKPILEKYENEGNPYYASARLWDDGVISPVDTRKVLIFALQAIKNNPIPDTQFPVFRM